jgi:hypothetical protein
MTKKYILFLKYLHSRQEKNIGDALPNVEKEPSVKDVMNKLVYAVKSAEVDSTSRNSSHVPSLSPKTYQEGDFHKTEDQEFGELQITPELDDIQQKFVAETHVVTNN